MDNPYGEGIVVVKGALESRYEKIRKRLDNAGYLHEVFSIDSLSIVERLFNDVEKAKENLQKCVQQHNYYKKIAEELEAGIGPYKEENIKLYKENSILRMDVLRSKEHMQDKNRESQSKVRELESDNTDLKLLINQFVSRVKTLEAENSEKARKIGELQGKKVEVYRSDIKNKDTILEMEINCTPSLICPHCTRIRNYVEFGKGRDPQAADYIKIADSRIEALQIQIRKMKGNQSDLMELVSSMKTKVENRDAEIEKLRGIVKVGHGFDNEINGNVNINRPNSYSDKDLAMALKAAEMQLQILQRRNMNLEKKLKSSILQEHENFMLGHNVSVAERELVNSFMDIHVDKYPFETLTMQEKINLLEGQLSHCCQEKAKLKLLLEDCERSHGRGGGRTTPVSVSSPRKSTTKFSQDQQMREDNINKHARSSISNRKSVSLSSSSGMKAKGATKPGKHGLRSSLSDQHGKSIPRPSLTLRQTRFSNLNAVSKISSRGNVGRSSLVDRKHSKSSTTSRQIDNNGRTEDLESDDNIPTRVSTHDYDRGSRNLNTGSKSSSKIHGTKSSYVQDNRSKSEHGLGQKRTSATSHETKALRSVKSKQKNVEFEDQDEEEEDFEYFNDDDVPSQVSKTSRSSRPFKTGSIIGTKVTSKSSREYREQQENYIQDNRSSSGPLRETLRPAAPKDRNVDVEYVSESEDTEEEENDFDQSDYSSAEEKDRQLGRSKEARRPSYDSQLFFQEELKSKSRFTEDTGIRYDKDDIENMDDGDDYNATDKSRNKTTKFSDTRQDKPPKRKPSSETASLKARSDIPSKQRAVSKQKIRDDEESQPISRKLSTTKPGSNFEIKPKKSKSTPIDLNAKDSYGRPQVDRQPSVSDVYRRSRSSSKEKSGEQRSVDFEEEDDEEDISDYNEDERKAPFSKKVSGSRTVKQGSKTSTKISTAKSSLTGRKKSETTLTQRKASGLQKSTDSRNPQKTSLSVRPERKNVDFEDEEEDDGLDEVFDDDDIPSQMSKHNKDSRNLSTGSKTAPKFQGASSLMQGKPGTSQQSKPGFFLQDKPGISLQKRPDTSQQSKPGISQQSKPGISQQSKQGISQQIKPGISQQNKPSISQQTKSGTSQPSISQQQYNDEKTRKSSEADKPSRDSGQSRSGLKTASTTGDNVRSGKTSLLDPKQQKMQDKKGSFDKDREITRTTEAKERRSFEDHSDSEDIEENEGELMSPASEEGLDKLPGGSRASSVQPKKKYKESKADAQEVLRRKLESNVRAKDRSVDIESEDEEESHYAPDKSRSNVKVLDARRYKDPSSKRKMDEEDANSISSKATSSVGAKERNGDSQKFYDDDNSQFPPKKSSTAKTGRSSSNYGEKPSKSKTTAAEEDVHDFYEQMLGERQATSKARELYRRSRSREDIEEGEEEEEDRGMLSPETSPPLSSVTKDSSRKKDFDQYQALIQQDTSKIKSPFDMPWQKKEKRDKGGFRESLEEDGELSQSHSIERRRGASSDEENANFFERNQRIQPSITTNQPGRGQTQFRDPYDMLSETPAPVMQSDSRSRPILSSDRRSNSNSFEEDRPTPGSQAYDPFRFGQRLDPQSQRRDRDVVPGPSHRRDDPRQDIDTSDSTHRYDPNVEFLQKDNERLKTQLFRKENDLDRVSTDYEILQRRVKSLQNEVDNKREALPMAAQSTIRRLEEERTQMDALIRQHQLKQAENDRKIQRNDEKAANELRVLQAQLREIERIHNDCKIEKKQTATLKLNMESEIRKLRRDLNESQSDGQQWKMDAQKAKLALEQTERILAEVQKRASSSSQYLPQRENQEMAQQIRQYAAREKDLERELGNLRASLKSLDRDKDDMRVELDQKDEKLASIMNGCTEHMDEISRLQLKLKNCELQLGHTGETTREQDREMQAIRRQVESLRKDLEHASKERDDALKELRRISGVKSKGDADRRSMESELDRVTKESVELRKQLQKYIDEVRRIEDLLLQKDEEMNALMEHYRTLTIENSNLESHRTSLEMEMTTNREGVREAMDQNYTLKSQIASQAALIKSYEEEIERLTQTVATLENKLSRSAAEEKSLQADIKAARELIHRLETSMDKYKLETANMESMKNKLDAENRDLQAYIAVLEGELNRERSGQEDLEKLLASTREEDYKAKNRERELAAERDQLTERINLQQSRTEAMVEELSRYRLKATELQTDLERVKRQYQIEKSEKDAALNDLRRLQENLNSSSMSNLIANALGGTSSSISPSQFGSARGTAPGVTPRDAALSAPLPSNTQISPTSPRSYTIESHQDQVLTPRSDSDMDVPLETSTSRIPTDSGENIGRQSSRDDDFGNLNF